MNWVVVTFGVLILALGVQGVAKPQALMRIVERAWRAPSGLSLAFALRSALGVALLLAAPETRFPAVMVAFGALSLLSAALIPLLGYERIRRFLDWWLERPEPVVRGWSLCAAAFGAFLVYAAA